MYQNNYLPGGSSVSVLASSSFSLSAFCLEISLSLSTLRLEKCCQACLLAWWLGLLFRAHTFLASGLLGTFDWIIRSGLSLSKLERFWGYCQYPMRVTHSHMRAGFLRRCQNSLWQNSPKIMHFQAWKNYFKGQLISEQNFRAITSPKEQTKLIILGILE